MPTPSMTAEQIEFQEHARAWLEANPAPRTDIDLPLTQLELATREQVEYYRDWQRRCYEAGLVGADIAKEYGGLSMMIPALLEHGTEEQKRRFIPNALSAEEIWCQGFSEPGAGSDMANQQTTATRRGDEWVVNGHKVWTSFGQFAKWMILIARTSREHKYDGLSFFLCPVEGHPGVTVKPLVKMTGELGFNEVFFEDVVIDDSLRLDDVGKGWTVAMTVLTFERGAGEGAGGGISSVHPIERLIGLARSSQRNGGCAANDPVTRDAIIQQAIVHEGLRQNARRARIPALTDHPLRLPMQQKVVASEFEQSTARLGVDIAGARSMLYKHDPAAPDDGYWPLAYMNTYGLTISGGSNEIQRNILGERVLGMPKSK